MHQRNSIDFNHLAPQIIDKVARQLMPNRPIFSETDNEIRFGNRGSFCVDKTLGRFYNHEDDVGGGVLDMITHLTDCTTREQALNWLQDHGYLDNTFQRNDRDRPRPNPNIRHAIRFTAGTDFYKLGLKLWNESEPVTLDPQHPVRLWCGHRNLWQPDRPLPKIMRWHQKQSKIIVALAPFDDFLNAYPKPPAPLQFHLISITSTGERRGAKGKDKLKFGSAPEMKPIALIGDPNAPEVAICEGFADALSIFARRGGCVIASTTTISNLIKDDSLMSHLSANRTVRICSDQDKAGYEAQDILANALHKRGADVFLWTAPQDSDPAEEARHHDWK